MLATRRRFNQQCWVHVLLAMGQAEKDRAYESCDSFKSFDSNYDSSESDDDDIAGLAQDMVLSESYRYLQRPGMYRKPSVNNLEHLQKITERECRSNLQMGRASFDRLLLMITDHDVFQSRMTCFSLAAIENRSQLLSSLP